MKNDVFHTFYLVIKGTGMQENEQIDGHFY